MYLREVQSLWLSRTELKAFWREKNGAAVGPQMRETVVIGRSGLETKGPERSR